MKILIDTNIVIHREASVVVMEDIGKLFHWLAVLNHEVWIHPVTLEEINRLQNQNTQKVFKIKLDSYRQIQSVANLHPDVKRVSNQVDINENDINDTRLINEVYQQRVDVLISEDKKIHKKAVLLGISTRVFTVDSYLEKVNAENPKLADYKVLAVKKALFGDINLKDDFFQTFREDYPGFDQWFNKKSQETAYVCTADGAIGAFLYLKVENTNENYSDISPHFLPKRRLKVGTFKVTANGFRLGERFVKVIFDNAIRYAVDEVYVTIFDKRSDQKRLIDLLIEFGFVQHGTKQGASGTEQVYVRTMTPRFLALTPKFTYPYISRNTRYFLVPIWPQYHTELFPDSILRTESPLDFVENTPHRNAISKVYISRSYFRQLQSGDILVFYRTGGFHISVISTIGIVENVVLNIRTESDFVAQCRKRSVFTDTELLQHWNYQPKSRPFIVNFLYVYSFPHRLNMKKLIDMGVIANVGSAPRGFEQITQSQFDLILQETQTNARIIVD